MIHRLTAPLLSGLVMPGLGQVINRQPGKGALLIVAMSLFIMALLFMTASEVSRAILALGEAGVPAESWAALREELARRGAGWLWYLLAPMAGLWLYAVVDAARWGARRDRAAREGGS